MITPCPSAALPSPRRPQSLLFILRSSPCLWQPSAYRDFSQTSVGDPTVARVDVIVVCLHPIADRVEITQSSLDQPRVFGVGFLAAPLVHRTTSGGVRSRCLHGKRDLFGRKSYRWRRVEVYDHVSDLTRPTRVIYRGLGIGSLHFSKVGQRVFLYGTRRPI